MPTNPGASVSEQAANDASPVPMLDLQRQYQAIKDEIGPAVERVMTTQHLIGGPELENFEKEAAQYLGVAECAGCASGTDALWLALAASGVGPGDRVVTPAFTFFASASSVTRCGAVPVFADIDPATFNIDPSAVQRILQSASGTAIKAIMPVHLYGQCVDADAYQRLSSEFGVAIVEDAAQAFGATWRERKAGGLGTAAAFSFYPTKNLSAFGDAGCVTTNEGDLAARVRRLRNHGSRTRYYHEEIGWNSRLDAIQAAVLRVKLKHIDQWNARRSSMADRYCRLLIHAGLVNSYPAVSAKAPISLPTVQPGACHIYHQYVIRAWRRDELRTFLSQRGIGTEIYYPVPLHLQQSFAYLGYASGDLPESERAAGEVLALPIFPELREEELDRVVAGIVEFYSRS